LNDQSKSLAIAATVVQLSFGSVSSATTIGLLLWTVIADVVYDDAILTPNVLLAYSSHVAENRGRAHV